MPAAIPAIIGAAASAGITAVWGTVLTTTFGAFGAALISGLGGAIASTAVGALITPDAPDTAANLNFAGAGRTQQVRQPISPQQVPFGRLKQSGPILFVHTTDDESGTVNSFLYLVHGLAGVHVKGIDTIYIGEDLSTDAKFAIAGGVVRVGKHLGEPGQVADADFVAEIPAAWTSDHRLRGRAYIATRLKYRPEAFPSGIPNIAAIVDGNDEIYDPRTGVTGFTNNAALCIAKWFTADFGMNLAWDDLDEDSVIAAANDCDERVLVQGDNTATADPATDTITLPVGGPVLDWGDGVRFTSTGTLPGGISAGVTYYAIPTGDGFKLSISVGSAFDGSAIDITTAGTGTLTSLLYDEARYKLNGSYTLDAAKGDTLKLLLSAMAGVAVYIGGKWFVHAGAAAIPTITLDEDDLRADLTWIPKRSMRDRFNGVKAVYVNPSAKWQPVDAPPMQSAAYLAEDDGEELYEDIRLPFTTSTSTAQRLMKIALERNRRQGVLQFPAKLSGMRLQPWDGVYITNERYGWNQKQFRVVGWALAEDGGVDLTLQEDDAAVYAWTAAEEAAAALQQQVVLPDPSTIAAPAVTVITVVTPTYTAIEASWTESASIWLDAYDVEYRADGASDWISYGRVGESAARVAQIERGAATDVRVRAVTDNGSVSDWSNSLAPDKPTAHSATAFSSSQINLAWTNGAGVDAVQIFVHTANDFSASSLLHTTSGAATSYNHTGLPSGALRYYWLRSVGDDGNVSDETTPVNATTS